jgi:hypothetical protein
MNRKLKALWMLLSAVLAVGAFAVVSAPAETGGHFVSEVTHTELKGTQDTAPGAKRFELHSPIGTIFCAEVELTGTANATTLESVTIEPDLRECTRTESTNTFIVDMNGCTFTITVRKAEPGAKDNTTHMACPPGKSIALKWYIEHGNTLACTMHFPPQTPGGGITYGTTGSGSTHAITSSVTVTGITSTRTPAFFGGCFFAPEHGANTEITGNAVVTGFNTEGKQIGITAT